MPNYHPRLLTHTSPPVCIFIKKYFISPDVDPTHLFHGSLPGKLVDYPCKSKYILIKELCRQEPRIDFKREGGQNCAMLRISRRHLHSGCWSGNFRFLVLLSAGKFLSECVFEICYAGTNSNSLWSKRCNEANFNTI